MKIFKKLFTGAALVAALAFVPVAKAQLGNPQVVFSTANLTTLYLSNAVPVGVTNVYTMDPKAKDLVLQINFAMSAAGTSNLVVNIDKALTGSGKWMLAAPQFLLAGNGTTEVNFVTNITVGAVDSIRLRVTCNTDTTSVVTNCTIRARSN